MNDIWVTVFVAFAAVAATLLVQTRFQSPLNGHSRVSVSVSSTATSSAAESADLCSVCNDPDTASWDVIVVGGGTAGCVISARLIAAHPEWSILVLERGDEVSTEPHVQPPSWNAVFEPLLSDPVGFPVEPHAVTIPVKYAGWTQEFVPRVMGGGPQISGSFWGRGDPKNYNAWSTELNDTAWNYTNLLPLFKRAEHFQHSFNPTTAVHDSRGRAGPILVTALNASDERIEPFVSALAGSLNTRRCEDYNTESGTACVSPLQRTFGHHDSTKGGESSKPVRSSTWSAYLQPLIEDTNRYPNARVHLHSTVIRIRFDGTSPSRNSADASADTTSAIGVEYVKHSVSSCACLSKPHAANPRGGQLVMSSGAFGNPKIFKLSGVGQTSELHQHHIPVIRDVPGMGENLQDHFAVPFMYALNRTLYPTGREANDTGYTIETFTTDGEVRPPKVPESVLAQDSTPHIAFFRSSVNAELDDKSGPDMEVLFALTDRQNSMVLAGSFLALHNEARGSVKLSGTDPYLAPIIGHHWPSRHLWERDQRRFGELLERLRAAFLPIAGVVTEVLPGFGLAPRNASLPQIAATLSQFMFGYHHPAGTCKMGRRADRMSVVDSKLRLIGFRNVRVADNSVMPRLVSQHPSATATVIADFLADHMLADTEAALAACRVTEADCKP